jgi:pimeloyl-ACP methyl ester carboxylesterase
MIEEFLASGLVDLAATKYRVLVFDRPGFGHSNRPRGRTWTPKEQARLLLSALRRLDAGKAIVLGHSWGTLSALALAFADPSAIAGLVLVSGYYFPEPKHLSVNALALPAVPGLGGLLRYTLEPCLARVLWGRIKRLLFSPAPVSPSFDQFPLELALRPSQLRANAEEIALLQSAVNEFLGRYEQLSVPAAIVAGEGDRLVEVSQPLRLRSVLPDSTLSLIHGAGHMVHHTAPGEVMEAIESLAARSLLQ